jgi:asparagine synthase (glutamine-hydrolysing)
MCGIAGIYNYASTPVDESEIAIRMRDAIAHRGPDAAGFYQSDDRRVVLGHRRLAIIDLSEAGRQPMANEDGRIRITFNGEIYNHADHRKPLESKGHVFASHCDTEAIIHLYEEHGADCVRHLDGMFAFAIWDDYRGRLFAARDRLGKKPFYYTVVNGRLLFASEIKALLQHPDVHRDLDREALDTFLTFSNTAAPRTLLRNVFKLPAAHTLMCDSGGAIKTTRYWSPLDGPNWPARNGRESVECVRDILTRSVKKRLMSDVPLGAFLSGGVDSSANVALMSQLTSEPLRTFSVGFEGFGKEQNFHDLPYARRVASEFGCRHEEITVTSDDLQRALPELVVHQDEPIGDPACLPMHFVSRAARQAGMVVVLVGEGSPRQHSSGTCSMPALVRGDGRTAGSTSCAARRATSPSTGDSTSCFPIPRRSVSTGAGRDVSTAGRLRSSRATTPTFWRGGPTPIFSSRCPTSSCRIGCPSFC